MRISPTAYTCAGKMEYKYRDHASRRRQWKGKSQNWDSKIRRRVPRDSDLRKTLLARASSIYKRQTHPLIKGPPHKNKSVLYSNKYLVRLDTKTYWLLTINRNVTLTLSNLALFADDRTTFSENSNTAWCEHWNIKINEDKTWAIYFPHSIRPSESLLTLNGRNIPFLNSVKYLYVIFDKKITWRPHREMIKTKAFRTFIRVYVLFKSERLSTNIKLTLHKALIRSVMTHACFIWEFVADTHLIKLQRLENKVPHSTDNTQTCMPVREMQMASHLPYVHDYMPKIMHARSRSHSKSWQWKCSLYSTRWSPT
jgi:hypothetical protein